MVTKKERESADRAAERAEDKAALAKEAKEEDAKAEADAIAADDAAIAAAKGTVEVEKSGATVTTLPVPTEAYSPDMMKFMVAVHAWLDEVQRHGMHRGETLMLVAPKE